MKKVFFLVGFALIAGGVFGQETVTLTFEEAVKIALEKNVLLNTEKNRLLTGAARKNSAIGAMAPRINLSANAYKTHGNQFIESEGRVVNDAQTSNLQAGVNSSLMLFSWFNNIYMLKSADNMLDAQLQTVNRTTQLIISNVSAQYLQCLLDKELVSIQEKNLESQNKQLEQIIAFVEIGTRAKVDEYNQMAQTKTTELDLLRARFALRNDLATLAQTLQLDPLTVIELGDPSWDLLEVKNGGGVLGELVETALANRPDYQALIKLESASKHIYSANRTLALPSLSAFGSIGSFYTDASVPEFNDQFDTNQRLQYGLTLNIPIFNRLENRFQSVQSKVEYENAKLARENIEILVKSDVIRAYNNYQDVLQAYEVSQSQFEAAQMAFDFEKERYSLGIINLVEYTVANRTFVEAETNYAQATFNLLFQKIALDFAVGILKFETNP